MHAPCPKTLLKFLFAVARWGQRNSATVRAWGSATVFLFAGARWGQRNSFSPQLHLDRQVSIRCREMGTAEHVVLMMMATVVVAFLFAVARWGQRNTQTMIATAIKRAFLFAVARWGQRNSIMNLGDRELFAQFLFAVARWGRRNCRCDRHGGVLDRRFYSLSRDGDSGTRAEGSGGVWGSDVSIRCREMGTAELRGQDSGCTGGSEFLFAVARWGQRNSTPTTLVSSNRPVSIRCREMGTAEHAMNDLTLAAIRFLFAVARWGQWNMHS